MASEGKASPPQTVHSHLGESPGSAVLCHHCGKACKGEVLRVQKKHFHITCFVCKACGCDLSQGGFFVRQGDYICTLDYQRLYGTRCFSCDQFIEGEVVSALGKTYHPHCFVCVVCRHCSLPDCGGCGSEIKNGQSLVALDKHWHLTCFKCKTCGKVLNAEYISKDGAPYCEMDYHVKFGIRCDSCEKYIMGRVLEAGEKHYHPTCARCLKCHQMFAEGEEMYLQGTSILHPACRQAARVEEKTKLQETRTSSESIMSVPASSTSGSPSRVIYAKLGDEIMDYRDLAALPKDKAIYNIDRPDMISYSPYISYSSEDRRTYGEGDQDDRPCKQYRTSSPSSAGSLGYGCSTPPCHSPQSYSRPAGTQSLGTSSCLSLPQHTSLTSAFRHHHYIPFFKGSESGRSTPSLSMYSDSKSSPSLYPQAPRHFHVPDTGVKDNIYRKPPIYKHFILWIVFVAARGSQSPPRSASFAILPTLQLPPQTSVRFTEGQLRMRLADRMAQIKPDLMENDDQSDGQMNQAKIQKVQAILTSIPAKTVSGPQFNLAAKMATRGGGFDKLIAQADLNAAFTTMQKTILDNMSSLIKPLYDQMEKLQNAMIETKAKAEQALNTGLVNQTEIQKLHQLEDILAEKAIHTDMTIRQNYLKIRGMEESIGKKGDLPEILSAWLQH
ncbi:PREDICTED: actin-binding LIM protein 2 [Gekko japonicus]|uniref:Actin-binding LIM protein 2 n=1 Tax=Gekko japonicus TaxID=146911 RepID=A0ABM1KT99_GEKJA|nr:PREDICTED: actin-binding LIM protein 2 [Gekko japonicus]